MIAAILALVVTSTSSPVVTSTNARALASCRAANVKMYTRVTELRDALEKIEEVDTSNTLLSHWPAILVGAACIAGTAILSDRKDIGEAATASLVSACSVLGFTIDWFTWSPDIPETKTSTSTSKEVL